MEPTTQLELIPGGQNRRDWIIDDRTRRVGRQGVAEARAILARARRPDDVDLAEGRRRAS